CGCLRQTSSGISDRGSLRTRIARDGKTGSGVMKKLLTVSIALAALMGAARAADTSVLKTPVPTEPPFLVYNWTGFYIGVQGGGGWARMEQKDARPFSSDPYFATGGMIGGTLGVNVQSGQIVLGLEADGASSWIKESTIGTSPFFGNCGGTPPRCFANLQALATVRARAGLAMDNVLPYLTGALPLDRSTARKAMWPPMAHSARVRRRSSAGPPVSG